MEENLKHVGEGGEDWEKAKRDFLIPNTTIYLNSLMQEDPDVPLTEDEYRRRRPHSTYKSHINVEKVVVKCGKVSEIEWEKGSSLSSYVGRDFLFASFV